MSIENAHMSTVVELTPDIEQRLEALAARTGRSKREQLQDIIAQGVEVVDHSHYPEDLIAKGRDIEAQTLARGVGYHIERRVFLNANRTVVL